MNNTLRFTALAVATAVVVGAFAFLGTRLAQAQGGSPWDRSARMSGTVAPGMGAGYGMMGGGYRMRGNGQGLMAGVDMNAMHAWMTDTGGVHTQVWASLADTLGLTPDELTAQFAEGQTLAQIAESQGVSQEQLAAAHLTAAMTALEQAVADGVLTQTQADQMLARMTVNGATMFTHMGAMGGGFGPGNRMVPLNPQTIP